MRGPYVMEGYLEPSGGSRLRRRGWFHTGDLMEQDEDGFHRLVDRKKEIYKNIKGETIAPSAWRTSSGTSKRSPACSWSATTASTARR